MPTLPELGARDERVAEPADGEVVEGPQRLLDRIRECSLLPAHRGDVADGRGEGDDVGMQIEVRGVGHGGAGAGDRLPWSPFGPGTVRVVQVRGAGAWCVVRPA